MNEWFRDIFVPHVNQVRERNGYSEHQKSLLILDGASPHFPDGIETYLEENNIILHKICANSSHLTQPLDLVGFGVLKKNIRSLNRCLNTQTPIPINELDIPMNGIPGAIGEILDTLKILNEKYPHFISSQFVCKITRSINKYQNGLCDVKDFNEIKDLVSSKLDELMSSPNHVFSNDLKNLRDVIKSNTSIEDTSIEIILSQFKINSMNDISENLSKLENYLIHEINMTIETNNEINSISQKDIIDNLKERDGYSNLEVNPSRCPWGHSITQKLLNILKSAHNALDPMTCIKSFERAGIFSLIESDGSLSSRVDILRASRLLKEFPHIKHHPNVHLASCDDVDKIHRCRVKMIPQQHLFDANRHSETTSNSSSETTSSMDYESNSYENEIDHMTSIDPNSSDDEFDSLNNTNIYTPSQQLVQFENVVEQTQIDVSQNDQQIENIQSQTINSETNPNNTLYQSIISKRKERPPVFEYSSCEFEDFYSSSYFDSSSSDSSSFSEIEMYLNKRPKNFKTNDDDDFHSNRNIKSSKIKSKREGQK